MLLGIHQSAEIWCLAMVLWCLYWLSLMKMLSFRCLEMRLGHFPTSVEESLLQHLNRYTFEVLFWNFKTSFIWKGCEKLSSCEWSFYFSCIYADQSCTSCTRTSYSFFWWRCFDWCVLGTIISFWWHEWQNTICYWSGSLSKACWASTVNIGVKSLLSNNHNWYKFWLIQCLRAV